MTTVQPEASFVLFPPDTPVRLRISGARMEDRVRVDPVTRKEGEVRALILDVTEVNGEVRRTTASFLSIKAQETLATYINSGEIFRRTVEITRRRSGYATTYEIRLL